MSARSGDWIPGGRVLPRPVALADVDFAAHRSRALRALTLYFGGDLTRSPAEWESRAAAVLEQLATYGMAPVWLCDPALPKAMPGPDVPEAADG